MFSARSTRPRLVRYTSASSDGLALLGREVDQHEVGHARRHLQSELADLLGQPVAPRARCALFDICDDARCPRARPPPPASPASRTLNGPRMRLTASMILAGPNIQPTRNAARPWILEKVWRHHRVVGGRHQLDAVSRSRCATRNRNRRRPAPAAHAAAGRRAAA